MRIDGPSSSLSSSRGPRAPCRRFMPQPAGHVGDVVLALAQVLVLDAREDRAELFVGAMHRPRRIDALVADDLLGAADEQRIVEHQDLRVEDRGELAPRAFAMRARMSCSCWRDCSRAACSTGDLALDAIRWESGSGRLRSAASGSTARPTATPGETPIPFRRSTCLLQTRCRRDRRARRGLRFVRSVGGDRDRRAAAARPAAGFP